MWKPVDLHNPLARERGLREALVAHLAQYPHHLLVAHGKQDGAQTSTGVAEAESFVQLLEACSIAYIGCRHMQPVAPFCAFSLAQTLGVARMEYLVDYQASPGSEDRWLTNAVGSLLWVLFREHPEVQQVAIPVSLREESFDEFAIKQIDGRSFAVRS